jgi:hypothetical protein
VVDVAFAVCSLLLLIGIFVYFPFLDSLEAYRSIAVLRISTMGKGKAKLAKSTARKTAPVSARKDAKAKSTARKTAPVSGRRDSSYGSLPRTKQRAAAQRKHNRADEGHHSRRKSPTTRNKWEASPQEKKNRPKKRPSNEMCQLQLPAENQQPGLIPWMRSVTPQAESTVKSRKRTASQRLPWEDILPAHLLQFDAELQAFAKYVQLTEKECQAREALVDNLQTMAETLFSSDTRDHISMQVFGSFATRSVCVFSSDIDLALWGVVAPPTPVSYPKKKKTPPPSSSSGNRKADSLKRWKLAFASLDAENAAAPDDLPPGEGTKQKKDADLSTTKVVIQQTTEDESSLFVLDREGAPTHDPVATASINEGGVIDLTNEIENEQPLQRDSDEDSADKLEAFALGSTTTGSTRESAISLTTSDEDDDSDDDEDLEEGVFSSSREDEEDNDMEISIFASAPEPSTPTPTGPTGRARTQVVDALDALRRKLRKWPFTKQVMLIGRARVPIVKLQTKLGVEMDVAVGGHNGTDTSHFAALQSEKFQRYVASGTTRWH